MISFKHSNFRSATDTAINYLSSFSQGTLSARQINGDTYTIDLGLETTDSPTFANLTVNGNLTAFGNITYVSTNVTQTSALEIENDGTATALIVNQTGLAGIADFQDNGTSVLYVADGGKVGINTTTPGEALTVNGNISTTGYLSADSIRFNLGAAITPVQGEIAWDEDDETLYFGMNGTTARIAQDSFIRVKADVAIKKGQAVRATGASGDGSGNITAALFSASSASGVDEVYFIGVAAEDMAINDFGFVSTFGKVHQVEVSDTRASDDPEYGEIAQNGWAIGTILYVSTTEAGKFTQTQPTAPNADIPCVIIVSTNGTKRTFFVRYEHGYHLDEIHDVKYIQPLVDGDLLTWSNTLSCWINKVHDETLFTTWAQTNSANYTSTYTTVNANSGLWNGGTLNYQRWTFTGNNLDTDFSITGMVEDDSEGYRVYIDNVVVDPADYSIIPATDTISFNTAPGSSADILVIGQYASQIVTISATGDYVQDFGYTQAGALTGTRTSGTFSRTNPKLTSVFTTTNSNSANWNTAYTAINTKESKWDSTYTTVNGNSATNWDNTNGESAYTTTQTNSASWNQFCPIGSVIAYAGSTAPTGWLLCEGSAVSRTTYAALFAVIGETYGAGDTTTTFNLPDLRGRVAAGYDSMDNAVGTGGGTAGRLTGSTTQGVSGQTLGATGGEQEHTQTEAELAAHKHTTYATRNTNNTAGGGGNVVTALANEGGGNITGETSTVGSGTAFNVVQPTIILNYIIRI